ncbi:MAG TPA: BrnT family toxin [Pyrinomonadaceae bacterium]|nr:BrnT family toxin [Pyrinomonadaceae bacterium]
MKFEWDDQKAVANLKKHGVSFGEATEIFYDPNALEGYDGKHSEDEARFFIIGLSSRRLLYVIYAERTGDVIRIISARKAVQAERQIYERTGNT